MSKKKKDKKKNKKKGSAFYSSYYSGGKGGKKKNRKKGNKPTLSKKELKKRDKEIRKTSMMPLVEEIKGRCNHAKVDKFLSVADFEAKLAAKYDMMNTAVLMAPVNSAVSVYGEDAVRVCPDCYEPIVDFSCIEELEIEKLQVTLRAMVNAAACGEKEKKVLLLTDSFKKANKQLAAINKVYRKKAARFIEQNPDAVKKAAPAKGNPKKGSSKAAAGGDAEFQQTQ